MKRALNNNRTPSRANFGARKQSSCLRRITVTRITYDDDGQCVGTEQVEAEVRFNPKNGCCYLKIDDDATVSETGSGPHISSQDAECLMAGPKARKGNHA